MVKLFSCKHLDSLDKLGTLEHLDDLVLAQIMDFGFDFDSDLALMIQGKLVIVFGLLVMGGEQITDIGFVGFLGLVILDRHWVFVVLDFLLHIGRELQEDIAVVDYDL